MMASIVRPRPSGVAPMACSSVTPSSRTIGLKPVQRASRTASLVSAFPRLCSRSRGGLQLRASAGVAHPSEEASEQHGGPRSQLGGPFMGVPDVTLAKGGGGGGGAGGSLGAVMERSRINIVMPTPPAQAPKLDDGGSGGDDGKHNHNGGGGGDGDDGDDDDYFGEGDGDGDGNGAGGGGGISIFRTALPELYDRLSIGAVLSEWYRTVAELPLFIRRAVEMGLFSSAQLVRFLSMDVRPNMARAAARALPPEWARGFVGRLMADPAFLHKMLVEQVLAFGGSMLYEASVRGEALKAEWDLAVINSLGLAAAVGATVWITAPSRAYGAVHKFPWQQMLAGLPHCVFDASGPLRQYSAGARVGGFLASAAQLAGIGALAGAGTSLASAAAVAAHKRADPSFTPSVPVPELPRSSGGLAAFFALNGNLRYQLLGGMDRYLFNHTNYMWTYLAATGVARAAGTWIGEMSRPWWQGLPAAPSPRRSSNRVRKVVRRKKLKQEEQPVAVAEGAAASSSGSDAAVGVAAAGAAAAVAAAAVASQAGVSSSGDASNAASSSAAGDLSGYAPLEAADAGAVVDAAAAAPSSAPEGLSVDAPGGAGRLEAAAESSLTSQPAVMGSLEGLQQLAAEQQQQQHSGQPELARLPSLSDGASGQALRDAVASEAVA